MDILKKLFYSDSLPTFSTKEEMQDLLASINLQAEDWSAIWEIYLTLRWHIQSQNGDCLAKESLRILREELHPDTQLLNDVDLQTREVFEDFVTPPPTVFSGIKNQTIDGRQVFYPSWVVADSEGPYFSPKGSDLPPSAKGKIGGVRACCERALVENSEESYPFRNPAFVADILAKSRAPIEETGEDSIRCKTLVDYLQRQIGEGDYDLLDYPSLYEKLGFLQDAIDLDDPIAMEEDLDLDDLIAMEEEAGVSGGQQFCLPGVESVLAYNFFHYTLAARHEMYPNYGFRLIAKSDNTELQTYLAFALARMDFQKHLPEIFSKQWKNRSVGRDFEELPMLFAIELMQAGHISKAVEMITRESAEEALLSGDQSLFTSIMCLPTALKKSREGSYCTVFAYACSRLPELLPEKAERDKALNSLERFVFNDSFLVKHLHPAMMLCALIGAMLRSGEFDRADQLQAKLNSLAISKEIKNECGDFYLDAAVFWYLNGSVENMLKTLSVLLRNHLAGEL